MTAIDAVAVGQAERVAAARGDRPIGFLQPADERARRALKALSEARPRDARRHMEATSAETPEQQAWKQLLAGWLSTEESDFVGAETQLRGAIESARTALAADPPDSTAPARLLAMSLERFGTILRRQDRTTEAHGFHFEAYHMRERIGSAAECWESANSLGLDERIRGRFHESVQWHRLALEYAGHAEADQDQRIAVAWTHLTNVLLEQKKFAEALDAAQATRRHWRQHDASALSAVLADWKAAHALARFGESLYDSEPQRAAAILSEALDLLKEVNEALLAFGEEGANDARWCAQEIEFVKRLRNSLDP